MFGQNEVKGRRALTDGFLVKEIFYTVQGEGPLAGVPATFVRFSDCNLACFFCDTDFTGGTLHNPLELSEMLAGHAVKHRCSLFVFTGGEPMLQEIFVLMVSIREVLEAMLGHNHAIWQNLHFQVETAGTVWPVIDGLELIDNGIASIVCSPKTPKVHPYIADYCNDYKYILRFGETDPVDGLPNKSTQRLGVDAKVFRATGYKQIWVQPCDEDNDPNASGSSGQAMTLQNMALVSEIAMKHGYRVSLQLHKILGLA
jgi:organic radical activating enzyme